MYYSMSSIGVVRVTAVPAASLYNVVHFDDGSLVAHILFPCICLYFQYISEFSVLPPSYKSY